MSGKTGLVSTDEMTEIEARTKETVCLVLTAIEFRHLTLQQFSKVAATNLRKNVSYRFIIPNDSVVLSAYEEFRNSVLAITQSSKLKCDYVCANARSMGLLNPIALFDPHLLEGEGYFRHFDGVGYSWLRMDRGTLESAFSAFEYFWATLPVTARFVPSPLDQTVPALVRNDYQEAANCALLKQNRAAITLFARVFEGVLRIYVKQNSLKIPQGLGLGQLLAHFKTLDHPFGKKQLNTLGFMINTYRIESVHVHEEDQKPDDYDVSLVWSAVRKVLAALPGGFEGEAGELGASLHPRE